MSDKTVGARSEGVSFEGLLDLAKTIGSDSEKTTAVDPVKTPETMTRLGTSSAKTNSRSEGVSFKDLLDSAKVVAPVTKKKAPSGVTPSEGVPPKDKVYTAKDLVELMGYEETTVAELAELVAKGVDVNGLVDDKSNTPLFYAIMYGKVSYVNFLLEKGANVTQTNKDGVTPLKQAKAMLPHAEKKGSNAVDEAQAIVDAVQGALNKKLLEEATRKNVDVNKVEDLLQSGADVNIADSDGEPILFYAIKLGNVELVQAYIENKVDVNKKSNDQTPLQLALQQLEEAKKAKNDAKIKAAEEIVKALKDAGAKEEEKKPEEKVVEVDSLKRAEGESLADWYARVAAYWGDQEAKLRTQIENEQDADKIKALTAQADYHKKLVDVYTLIYDKENALANETDPEKRKKLLAELTRLSSSLLEGVPTYYKTYHADVLADSKHPLAIQMDNQTSEIQKASNAYQKELLALNQKKVRPGNVGDRPVGGQGGSGQPVSQTPEVNVGTPPTTPVISTGPTGVTPALIDSVAQAKHDGAQEKSWWERNQEWIWWVLGIIVVAVLGYFGFKDGGWFNKEKKKTTTVASNTNENSNTNTNEGTGNTNTGTNTGNTNTGNADTNTGTNNDTLASSGRLYSAKEVNDAIAANAQNIINTRG